jgi:hypothetical protein
VTSKASPMEPVLEWQSAAWSAPHLAHPWALQLETRLVSPTEKGWVPQSGLPTEKGWVP